MMTATLPDIQSTQTLSTERMLFVLVVEDDESLREVMSWTLSDSGFEVAAVENGAEALAFVTANPPKLILLDMRMPVMDGWEFARRYRSSPGPHAPIVVVTAAADARGLAAQIEANGFLEKPFDVEELITIVQSYLNN
jgi:two-component system chemotaxis response regulator CheY